MVLLALCVPITANRAGKPRAKAARACWVCAMGISWILFRACVLTCSDAKKSLNQGNCLARDENWRRGRILGVIWVHGSESLCCFFDIV